MSFGDGHLFLGGLRGGTQGIWKYDIGDPEQHQVPVGRIRGRRQPLGRPVFGADRQPDRDQRRSECQRVRGLLHRRARHRARHPAARRGSTSIRRTALSIRRRARGSACRFPIRSSSRSVDSSTLIVRPIGGQALTGKWGHTQTVVTFWPDQPLQGPTQTTKIVASTGRHHRSGRQCARERVPLRLPHRRGIARQLVGGIDVR